MEFVTKNLSLSKFVVVAEPTASSEKVEAVEIVTKNLSLSRIVVVAESTATSEKVEVEGYCYKEPQP